jgi:hypothetical protein
MEYLFGPAVTQFYHGLFYHGLAARSGYTRQAVSRQG